jgi:molecular chaperone GrpE
VKDTKKEFDESIERDKNSGADLAEDMVNEEYKDETLENTDPESVDPDSSKSEKGDPDSTESEEVDPDNTESENEDSDEEDLEEEKESGKASFFKNKKKKSARILEKELSKAEAASAELKDRYQRLMAEFENARKRMDKEKGQMYDMGAKTVLEKLLPVIDNFERGLDALSEEEKQDPFAQGVVKIYQQMITTVTELGVSPIDAVGKEFNPDLHNAVMHVEDEELGENVVAEEFQKGYMYKDSVLRYSMVKVAN